MKSTVMEQVTVQKSASHAHVSSISLCLSLYYRVQTPGYVPKKTRWVFWVHPP